MPEEPQPVARLRDVTKSYKVGRMEVAALRGVSFEVRPARFTMLVAPSGSGKTTLLNLLGCIDRPTSGVVEVAGQSVAELGENALSDFGRGLLASFSKASAWCRCSRPMRTSNIRFCLRACPRANAARGR